MNATRFQRRLGRQLRARRLEMGRTQAEVAEHLELTRSSVSNIEAGNQSLSLIAFLRLAEYLDLKPGALLDVVIDESEGQRSELPGVPNGYWDLVNSFVTSVRSSAARD